MKTKLTFLTATLLFLFFANMASARARIPFGEMEKISVVHDLPHTEEYQLDNGDQMKLAVLYKEFNIAYILPLWITKEPKLVAVGNSEDTYYDIPNDVLKEILKSQNLEEKQVLKVPFYHRYGGKLVALLIIALLVYGGISKKEDKVKPQNV